MVPTPAYICADESRSASRSSLYLAATLYCDASSLPVKIRNISPAGALVEAAAIPSAGSLVQLVRGGLIVHGLIAWSSEGRCGLKFSGTIDVQQWRAVPGNREQQRVDDVVRLVKAGAVPLPVPLLAEAGQAGDPTGGVSADLRRAADLLDRLAEALAGDAEIVRRHAATLQNLDIALQVIAAVEAIVTGQSDPVIDSTKLSGLRRSADQALQAV
jgi:hypothetical protein